MCVCPCARWEDQELEDLILAFGQPAVIRHVHMEHLNTVQCSRWLWNRWGVFHLTSVRGVQGTVHWSSQRFAEVGFHGAHERELDVGVNDKERTVLVPLPWPYQCWICCYPSIQPVKNPSIVIFPITLSTWCKCRQKSHLYRWLYKGKIQV